MPNFQYMYYSVRRFFVNIWDFVRYEFPRGVRNLVRWFPIIWQDRDFDCCYLLQIMEKKLSQMAELQEKYGNGLYAARYARQMRIASLLCKRIGDDSYSDNAAAGYGYGNRAWAKEWTNVAKQDKEMLGRLIGKYIDHWWD